MKIIVTVNELIERGAWENFCIENGLDPLDIEENGMLLDREFTLNEIAAKQYGVI